MKPEYHDSDPSDAESLLSHSNTSQDHQLRIKRNSDSRRWPTFAIIAILTVTHLCVAIAAALASHQWLQNTIDVDNTCAKWTSHESPVTASVDIKWTPQVYNGSFFHQTVYRGDASPEVDAAWKALGVDYRALRIDESEAEAAAITIDHVHIREKYGGGHPANLEGLHHLHCLNLLRQGLVYNYDYYKKLGHGAFKNEEPVVKYHITHCLDIIRQQLMCTVDTGVLGQVWWDPTAPKPFVDFNTEHKCKNYDAIRQWAEARQLPAETPMDFLRKPAGRVWNEIP